MSLIYSAISLLGNYRYLTLTALLFGCILFRQLKNGSNPKGLPLPPGPKGYPLIGNLFNFPIVSPWLVYEEWCKTYGDIVYFNVLGKHFLVLGSLRRISDLLEQRSSNYSDRMQLPMWELMGWDFFLPSVPYGTRWRKQRKSFQEHFLAKVDGYIPIQRREVHTLLLRLLVTPEDFLHHLHLLLSGTIMKVVYDIDIQESDDPYISVVEKVLKAIHEASMPGTFLVDLLPMLKIVPSWFPGAGFQMKAAYGKELTRSMIEKPYRYVEKQLKDGNATSSMAASLIERLPDRDDSQRPMEERVAQDVTASTFIAIYDTTLSTVQALFLAMALYPEAQKKAQAEIDAVVGSTRLPDFEDRPSLPYINAVVKEVLRWHLVLPIAMPHKSTNDDEYDGYYIPKGTIVIGNAWSILHDPKTFNNPMKYQPERYLKGGKLNLDVIDPDFVAFGFGRRMCPGKQFANNSLYTLASCLLAVYDITPPVDDRGNVIELKPEFTSGLSVFPLPFKCTIKPRSPAAEALIRSSVHT